MTQKYIAWLSGKRGEVDPIFAAPGEPGVGNPAWVPGMRPYTVFAVATLALIASCTVQQPPSGNQPTATLYVFNVGPAVSEVCIYAKSGQFTPVVVVGTGPSTVIATVGGQRYVRLFVPVEGYFLAGPRQTTRFLWYEPGCAPEEVHDQESLANATPFVPGQTYYAKVRLRGFGEIVAGIVVGALPIPLGRRDLPPIAFDLISSDEGQLLLRQLKPQEAQPPQNASGAP